MKFADVMFSDLSDEQLMQLSDRERAMWFARPRRLESRAKSFMILRVVLLALAFFYFKDHGEARALLFVLTAYEFAYYTTLLEKLKTEYRVACEHFRARAIDDGLIPDENEA